MCIGLDPRAVASVARKEFLHIWRDRRVLCLLIVLPPMFTLIFGYAFETPERENTPALLINADGSERSQRFVKALLTNKAFLWRTQASGVTDQPPDLLKNGVLAALIIPPGWGDSLTTSEPRAVRLFLDGSDTNTATELEGRVQESLGTFQLRERQSLIDHLPEEASDLVEQWPTEVRNQFVAALTP